MKKTITLLMAAVGMVAGAATPVEVEWDENSTATLDRTIFAGDDVSIVFTLDCTKLTTAESTDLFRLSGNNGSWDTYYGMQHQYYDEWMFGVYNEIYGIYNGKAEQSVCFYDLAAKNPASIDVVYAYEATDSGATINITMYMYDVNGGALGSYSNGGYAVSSGWLRDLTSISVTSAAIDTVDVYNTALVDEAEIAAALEQYKNPSSPNVPEPATATLGLLALAGLAARRRRC